MAVLEIDGSFGEGGGQILRTALALSLITRTPLRMVNIRAKRAKPGLRRQHLTAVRAAARIGNAHVTGDAVGSAELVFIPDEVAGGAYEFDIGTAGSTTLVFQTILPALLLCSEPSTIRLTGGTHNHGGPPWDFLDRVFLPVLRSMGARVQTRFERYGFAPAGGGRWQADVEPSMLRPLEISGRGDAISREAVALVSNLPETIAEREIAVLRRSLDATTFRTATVESDGPGNIVMISGSWRGISELATGFGQRGIPAEKVAAKALDCWLQYERSGAPVGEHLADQLLLPMALAGGGRFLTMKPTLHTTTNAEVIRRFLPNVRFQIEPAGKTTWSITVSG